MPTEKVGNAKYNKLQYISSKAFGEGSDIGYIHMSLGKTELYDVTLSNPLSNQFDSLLDTSVEKLKVKDDMTLSLQMRTLYFSVGEREPINKGLCSIRISLYAVNNEDSSKYYFLNTLDTLVISNKKNNRKDASNAITDFLLQNLTEEPDQRELVISIDEVNGIDEFERNNIPFYTGEKIPNGIYYSYEALKQLTPDEINDNLFYNEKSKNVEVRIDSKTKKMKAQDVLLSL